MGDIEAALEALKSLDIGEKPNYAEIARKYGVERTTLSRRHRGVTRSTTEKYQNHQLLNPTQESELVKYIGGLCARGLPPTRQMIRNFASQIAGKEAGKNWADRFIKRHSLDLVSKWTSGIDSTRKRADSAFKYSLYFELLLRKMEQYKIEPQHIYNMDEKGFLIGILNKMKRVFSRIQYDKGKIKSMVQDGNREWITTIACICADGTSLTPALIYQAASGRIQDAWLQDFDPKEHKAFFTSSPSGWTNNDIGLAWLKQVFDRETKAKAKRSYRLLILDGHGSHVTMDFIKYCDDNKILLAILPPHSTHTLQPLDVCLFGPLATAYSSELSTFMDKCQGLSSITKRDFFRLFYSAWHASFKEKTILKAFKTTGISPPDPQAILKRFNVEDEEKPSSSESTTSVLSASDWRKIERLLRQTVEDIYDSRASKLSHTIHAISVQKTLLQHKVGQLEEALINEKKRRQRGKPLLLEAPEEYHGGAVFWSPSKVQAARDRQEQKDAEEKAMQLQKDEDTKHKKEKKKEKALLLEERRRARVAAREARELEKQKKAIEREEVKIARQAERQLKEDIKLSKKGKRKAPRLPKEPECVDVDISSTIDEVPSMSRSRLGRKIKLPERYLN